MNCTCDTRQAGWQYSHCSTCNGHVSYEKWCGAYKDIPPDLIEGMKKIRPIDQDECLTTDGLRHHYLLKT